MKIKTKDGTIIPFILNKPQQKLYDALKKQYEQGKPMRAIVLKARQMGFSTLTEAMIFKRTAMAKNVSSGIITHLEEATTNLFNMSKLYYEKLPEILKPKLMNSNARELVFNSKEHNGGLNSRIKCMTAGSEGIGRSDTFHNLHISEYAFWKGDKKSILAGLMQAVPNTSNSLVVIESTANGYDDFKQRWDDAVEGRSDFVPVFCAWWELEAYRMDATGIILTPEEIELKKLYNLDNEQIAWRRWCIKNNCGNDIDLFKQEYPSCPEEAFISSGTSVFDKELVIKQIERVRNTKPLKIGYFEYDKKAIDLDNYEISNIRWVEDSANGYIKIMREPMTIKDKKSGAVIRKAPYVIGGDIADTGEDYNTAKVVNCTNRQVEATLWKQYINEDLYADQLYCLGMYYHTALIGIETNYSYLSTRELVKLNYPNLYQRQRYDKVTDKFIPEYGWNTSSKTRPIAIANLVKLAREDITIEEDVPTLKEYLTFIKNEQGRAEAQNGSHDDLVMASAIAQMILEQQDCNWIEIEQPEYELPFALQTDDDDDERDFIDLLSEEEEF